LDLVGSASLIPLEVRFRVAHEGENGLAL
jgi:hypothetical protein